jgi:hypothetical protein
MDLSLNDRFEKERYGRLIDELSSTEDLKKVAKDLLSLYIGYKAAAKGAMLQALAVPPKITSIAPSQDQIGFH